MPSGWLRNADTKSTSKKDRAGGGSITNKWAVQVSSVQPVQSPRIAAQKVKDRRALFVARDMGVNDSSPSKNGDHVDGVTCERQKRRKRIRNRHLATTLNMPGRTKINNSASEIDVCKLMRKRQCLTSTKSNQGDCDKELRAVPVLQNGSSATRMISAGIYFDKTNPYAARRYDSHFCTKGKFIVVERDPDIMPDLQLKRCFDAGGICCIFLEDETLGSVNSIDSSSAGKFRDLVAVEIKGSDAHTLRKVVVTSENIDDNEWILRLPAINDQPDETSHVVPVIDFENDVSGDRCHQAQKDNLIVPVGSEVENTESPTVLKEDNIVAIDSSTRESISKSTWWSDGTSFSSVVIGKTPVPSDWVDVSDRIATSHIGSDLRADTEPWVDIVVSEYEHSDDDWIDLTRGISGVSMANF